MGAHVLRQYTPCGKRKGTGGLFSLSIRKPDNDKRMRPEEYLIASRAIHIELERLSDRILELAKFRCAELSNQAFLNAMERQTELLGELADIHTKVSVEFRNSSRTPLV